MKVVVTLLAVFGLAQSEAPYPEAGWRPNGALLVLPSRRYTNNPIGPPAQYNQQPSVSNNQAEGAATGQNYVLSADGNLRPYNQGREGMRFGERVEGNQQQYRNQQLNNRGGQQQLQYHNRQNNYLGGQEYPSQSEVYNDNQQQGYQNRQQEYTAKQQQGQSSGQQEYNAKQRLGYRGRLQEYNAKQEEGYSGKGRQRAPDDLNERDGFASSLEPQRIRKPSKSRKTEAVAVESSEDVEEVAKQEKVQPLAYVTHFHYAPLQPLTLPLLQYTASPLIW